MSLANSLVQTPPKPKGDAASSVSPAMRAHTIPISNELQAILYVPTPFTEKHLAILKKYLEIMGEAIDERSGGQ